MKKTINYYLLLPFALAVAAIITACGGGGLIAGGGIGGTGIISFGPILAFGSIWVNGVEYDIRNAAITINNTTATEADLTRGMIVRVKGKLNPNGISGTADSVAFSRDLAGTVSAVDTGNKTMTVLDQTVSWDNETFVDDEDAAHWTAPAIGDYVEISGIPTDTGYLARAINHQSPGTSDEVSGLVSGLDSESRTFMINGLKVQYQDMMNPPQNGDYVEAEGLLEGDVFQANSFGMRTPHLAQNNEDMEVEGTVQSYDPTGKMLNLLGSEGRYDIDVASAGFENGNETDLVGGRRIEVSGFIQNGTFYAEEISFKGGE